MSAGIDYISFDLLLQALLREEASLLPGFAASMQYGLLVDGATRNLVTTSADILYRAMLDQEDIAPALRVFPRFVRQTDRALRSQTVLESVRGWSDIRKAVTEIVAVPLSSVFGHKCRMRVWAIPPYAERYVGLLSLGMGETFRIEFEGGKQLPLGEAPYERIDNTRCLLLGREKVEVELGRRPGEDSNEALRWYREKLGLGPIIQETYTWHIPELSLASDTPVPLGGSNATWALSFDLGRHDAGERNCDRVLLKLVDRFVWALKDDLSKALERVAAGGLSAVPEAAEISLLSKSTIEPSAASKVAPEGGIIVATRPPPTASPTTDLEALFRSPLVCIPSTFPEPGDDPMPWICSENDPAASKVLDWVNRVIAQPGASTALAVGPSGAGKGILARTLVGKGRRPGPIHRFDLGDDPRQALMNFLGAEKDYYNNSDKRESVVRNAGSGVVLIDEFLTALVQTPEFDLLKGSVEELRQNRRLSELPQSTGRRWKPEALLVFTGPPEDYQVVHQRYKHWIRRFGPTLWVPGWLELTPQSRAAIFRWHLLREMAKRDIRQAEVHADAFYWLVTDPHPAEFFAECNMDGIVSIIQNAGAMSAAENGKLRLLPEHISDAIRDKLCSPASSPKSGSNGWLLIGQGSSWESSLKDELDQLIIRLALKASSESQAELESKEALWSALRKISSKDDVYDTAYLFCAAVRLVEAEHEIDPCRTAPNRYQEHFDNKAPWHQVLAKYLPKVPSANSPREATPADLKVRGPAKGPQGDAFEEHVIRNAARLQSTVERLACVHPPFFHVVPYWNWPHMLARSYANLAAHDLVEELK